MHLALLLIAGFLFFVSNFSFTNPALREVFLRKPANFTAFLPMLQLLNTLFLSFTKTCVLILSYKIAKTPRFRPTQNKIKQGNISAKKFPPINNRPYTSFISVKTTVVMLN